MALRQDEYTIERQLRKAERDRAAILASREIVPTRIDPGQRAANLVDIAEVKTAQSRQALALLRIEGKLDELIAETRARELRTDYPHEPMDTDDRFV